MNKLSFKEQISFFVDAVKNLGCEESNILKQEFDIACKCPVCGDSRTRKNLKRLHFYQKGDVQNVNCFNGDCNVKNMTLYSFLKTYDVRVFEQFKQYYKRKFLWEIQSEAPKLQRTELYELSAGADIFDVTGKPADSEVLDITRELNKQRVLGFIQNFRFTGNDDLDFQNVQSMIREIKALGDQAFQDFKELIN